MSQATRSSASRAKEFDLVFSFLKTPKFLSDYIKSNPAGGKQTFEGIRFEYGQVQRLSTYLDGAGATSPFDVQPQFVCHLDSLASARKREIEVEFDLNHGDISSENVKADVFFVDLKGRPYFVSVKDDKKPAKLGQVSRDAKFGTARLHGGLPEIRLPNVKVPETFTFNDTALTEKQFSKLTLSDKKFAYFKKQFPNEWADFVKESEDIALVKLRQFCQVLINDRESLIQFVGDTLGSNLKNSPNFYLLIGKQKINLCSALEALSIADLGIEIEEYKPKKKTSIIIWIKYRDQKYCLTKIEASFDGKRQTVSQTKGVIYYFQQHLKCGNHYKKLLLDIAQ